MKNIDLRSHKARIQFWIKKIPISAMHQLLLQYISDDVNKYSTPHLSLEPEMPRRRNSPRRRRSWVESGQNQTKPHSEWFKWKITDLNTSVCPPIVAVIENTYVNAECAVIVNKQATNSLKSKLAASYHLSSVLFKILLEIVMEDPNLNQLLRYTNDNTIRIFVYLFGEGSR